MLKSIQHHFTAEAKSLDLKGKVYLEDFYDDTSGGEQFKDLHTLTLSISFEDNTPAENESLYEQAVQNLKKMAPNLKAVYFDGGYVYNPNRIDDNADTFHQELADLHHHFDSLSKIFKNQDLPVAAVNFRGTQVFEKYSINESYYSELISELFGHKMSDQEVQTYSTSFTYTLNDIPFQIELYFNVETTHENEPKNRRRCFLANSVETC